MRRSFLPLLALRLAACAPVDPAADDENAFVDAEQAGAKFDTGYQSSLDAQEVEVDIEGDVQADAGSRQRAPLDVGQFALTYLRKHDDVFIQSLAEDYAHGTDQIEWLVAGKWVRWAQMTSLQRAAAVHFRMRAVS